MSWLTATEKIIIERFLDMKYGYVLDFSNAKFADFIFDNSSIAIYDDKYCQNWTSKASILRVFLKIESDFIVGNLLKQFAEYWKIKNILDWSTISNNGYFWYKECLKISERLVNNNPIQHLESLDIIKINNTYIKENIDKCDRKIIDGDYSWAVTNARSLVETVLLHIQSQLSNQDQKFDGNLNILYKTISSNLNLSVNRKTNDSFRQLMSGLFSIIAAIAELGNELGDRHGKIDKNYIVEKHHAILVVNSAKIFTNFIFSSYEKQCNIQNK